MRRASSITKWCTLYSNGQRSFRNMRGLHHLNTWHTSGYRIPMSACNIKLVPHQSVSSKSCKPEVPWNPKLIIFDLNGTLLDFHNTWTPWIMTFAQRLEKATGLQLEDQLYNRLSVCHYTNKARHGLLAEGSIKQIKLAIVDILTNAGIPLSSARLILEECWMDSDVGNSGNTQEAQNLQNLFTDIKNKGIQIAICTADNRITTQNILSTLGLLHLVDCLSCGDDSSCCKPDPELIHDICKKLQVETGEVALVGDTEADMYMGYHAGVGLTVGVLSGIGTRLNLTTYADYITEDIRQFANLILPYNAESNITKKAAEKSEQKSQISKVELVIFDKDGTLLCFHSMWTPWAKDLVEKLEKATQLKLYNQVMHELGYCHKQQKWTPGILAEGTQHQNQEKIKGILQMKGVEECQAQTIVDEVWTAGNHDTESENVQILDNPTVLFKILQENGVKVAICTADSREATDQFLKAINAEDYVDFVVCGDDPDTEPKPAPTNALLICDKLGIDPSKAIVVGDTIADMGMGKSAKLGATVAVLSGVGGVQDLDSSADHVVSSIGQILPFVFKSHSTVDPKNIKK